MVQASITLSAEVLDIEADSYILEKATKAIKTLKDWKAPEFNQKQSEMLKADELVIPRVLTEILKNIWDSNQTPS